MLTAGGGYPLRLRTFLDVVKVMYVWGDGLF